MPPLVALDRLKSQLLTSGLQQRDNPLYQVINQLIDFLRNSIDATQLQLGDLQQCCDSTKVIPNNVSNAPFPPFLESGESLSDYNPIGYIPGPVGPTGATGATGPAGSPASMPYWFPDDEDAPELPALMTLANVGSIPESSIANGIILARVADSETISGQWTFTNSFLSQQATTPQFAMKDNTGGVDDKWWRFLNLGTSLYIQALNDAFSVGSVAVEYQKSAGVVLNHVFYSNNLGRTVLDGSGLLRHLYSLAFSGQSYVTLVADQTAWSPSGLGTIFYLNVTNNSGVRIIRGITAQTNGYMLWIFNVGANGIQFTDEDAAASAANRIRTPAGLTITLGVNNGLQLYYDSTMARWVTFY